MKEENWNSSSNAHGGLRSQKAREERLSSVGPIGSKFRPVRVKQTTDRFKAINELVQVDLNWFDCNGLV
jgi:hypothetical protein